MEIVKVKYLKDGQPSGREYSYFTEDILQVGDIVTAPTFTGDKKAQVSAVNIPESEIESFRAAVRTIPAGSRIELPLIETIINQQQADKVADEFMASVEHKYDLDSLDQPVEIPSDNWKSMEPLGPITDSRTEAEKIADGDFIPESPHLSQPDIDITEVTICIRPDLETSYQNLLTSLTSLKDHALSLEIKTIDDLTPATNDLTVIAGCKKDLKEMKDRYITPIKTQLDAVKALFKTLEDLLDVAENENKNKIKEFNRELEKRAAEIAEVNRQAEELARKQAELNNGAFTVDTTPIEAPAPVKRVSTQSGSISYADNWTWVIEDINQVPREYMILDRAAVTRRVKAGERKIAGIRIFNDKIIKTTTR